MSTYIERMSQEEIELQAKIYGLHKFISKPKPNDVLPEEWELLKEQHEHMVQYSRVLNLRIELATGKESSNVI